MLCSARPQVLHATVHLLPLAVWLLLCICMPDHTARYAQTYAVFEGALQHKLIDNVERP